MRIPVIRGVIDRRILVNYHVDPRVLAPLLPAPFRPKVVHGIGMVGICLIRLKKVRPTLFPSWLGIASENAVHRTAGSLGYSATPDPSRFQGLELRCLGWRVEPLEVEEVRSSFFEDESYFPKGSIEFDCALLMRGIEHEWHGRADLCCQRRVAPDEMAVLGGRP